MVDNTAVIKRLSYKTKITERGRGKRIQFQHLCLDKAYNSEPEEQELIKRGYVLHIHPKRKISVKEREIKGITQHCSNRKKHYAKRWWVVEQTNS